MNVLKKREAQAKAEVLMNKCRTLVKAEEQLVQYFKSVYEEIVIEIHSSRGYEIPFIPKETRPFSLRKD